MPACLLRKRLIDLPLGVLTLPPGPAGSAQVWGARGAALTAALEVHHARMWTPGLDLAILLRTAWINLVGKRRGSRPLPPGRA